jgi:hypothetical protein
LGVGLTALRVQWVGIEVKHAGKMKLSEYRMFGICKSGKDRRNSDIEQRPGLVTG